MYQFTTKNTKLQRSYYNTKLKQPQGITKSNLIKNSIYYKNRCSSVVVNNRNVNSFKTYNNYKQQYNNVTISCDEISKYTEIYGNAKTKNEIYCNLPSLNTSMINFCIHKKYSSLTYDVIRSIINNNFIQDIQKNHLLDTIPLSNPFIGKGGTLNSMSELFKDAGSGINPKISHWDVSNITNMSNMFNGAISFNADISNWIVSYVSNMENMFSGATSFNANISNWNVSSVTNMSSMFNGATSFYQDISNWANYFSHSNLPSILDMFKNTKISQTFNEKNKNIFNSWKIEISFNNLLDSGLRLPLPSEWSYIYIHHYITDERYSVSEINEIVGHPHINIPNNFIGKDGSVNSMTELFKDAGSGINPNISHWIVSDIINMESMFANATSFNADISNWNVSKVTNMSNMFNGASSFDQDLSWNVSKVTNMIGMFIDSGIITNSNRVNKNLIYTRWFNCISNNAVPPLSKKKIFTMLEDSGLIEEKVFRISLKHGWNNIYFNGYFKSDIYKNSFSNPLSIHLDKFQNIYEDINNANNITYIKDIDKYASYYTITSNFAGSLTSINNNTSYLIKNVGDNMHIKYYGYDLMYPVKFDIKTTWNWIGNPYNFDINIKNFNSYINNNILGIGSKIGQNKEVLEIESHDPVVILGQYNTTNKIFDLCLNIDIIHKNEGFRFISGITGIMSFDYQSSEILLQ